MDTKLYLGQKYYQAIGLLVLSLLFLQGCGLVDKINQPKLSEVKIQRIEQGLKLIFNNELLFEDFNDHQIKPGQEINLEKLAEFINNDFESVVLVEGHTDSTGDEDYNFYLSQMRADSVRAFLIEQGVEPIRIKAYGYGEDEPIASNETVEGRRLNCRLVVILDNTTEKKNVLNQPLAIK